MLGRGYDINTIKPSLIKWGYNVSDIDAAISDIYGYNQQTTQVGVGLDYVNLRGLLFKPKSFFSMDLDLKKGIKYFLYSFLFFLLVNPIMVGLSGFLSGEYADYIFESLLTALVGGLIYLISIILFFIFLFGIYFLVFKTIFPLRVEWKFMITLILFSLVPYILTNAFRGVLIYDILSLINVNVGFFNINIFFIWSMLLFVWGFSHHNNISFKDSMTYVFVPFCVLFILMILIFYDVISLNLVSFVFQKF
jgi:hypothetical protein